MRRTSLRTLLTLAVFIGLGCWITSSDLGAQGVLDRIKKAAEKAKRAAEARKPPAPPPSRPQTSGPAPRAGAPASSAKVEAEVLLTMEPGQQLQYVISPVGQHVAAVVLRGSRQVVVYDGVDGPPFDRVYPESIAFSPDGNRYAYVAQQGQAYVYIVDGREITRVQAGVTDVQSGFASGAIGTRAESTGSTNSTFRSNQTTRAEFTANSRHVYFLVRTRNPARNDSYAFFFDGKTGPSLGGDGVAVAFSADGDRYAYLATSPQNSTQRTLIVDGKPTSWPGGEPQFTGDSKHLLTSLPLSGGAIEVHRDGKPWLRVPGGLHLYFAPVTDLVVAAVAGKRFEDGWFLHVGNGRVPGSDCATVGVVFFSADGRHWAAACKTAAGSTAMIVDGKKGLEYQDIEGVAFTADGRFVYKAVMPGAKQFIVVGDKESDAYQQIIPSGVGTNESRTGTSGADPYAAVLARDRVGFLASRTVTADSSVVVIDGKATPAVYPSALTFSPDGSRYAYAFGRVPSKSQIMVDGAAHSGMILAPDTSREPKLTFSPDGKHLAYAAYSTDERIRGLSLNGKFISYSQVPNFSASNRTFTPDGRHLLWLAGFQRGRSAIYVDGLRAVELQNDGLQLVPRAGSDRLSTWWSMGTDGTLTVIAQDGGSLKRFRITPGPDTSVDTLAKMNAIQ